MVVGRLVNFYHTNNQKQVYMNCVLRTPTGKQHLTDIPTHLYPYGFVPHAYRTIIEALDIEFPVRLTLVPREAAYFVDSDQVILRVETDLPEDLLHLYRELVNQGYTDCYEMDWPFELRHLNEKGYGLVLEVPNTKDGILAVTDPEKISNLPFYRWVFLAMLIDDGFDMWDYKQSRILVVQAMDGQTGERFEFRDDHKLPDESDLLERLIHFLQPYDFPIFWTSFKHWFLKHRCEHLGISMNWQEWYWLAMQHLVMKHQPSIARRLFDLGEFVREAVGLEEPEFDAEIYETYRTEPERLSAYCADLVHLLYAANSKLKIIEMEIFLAEMLGVPLQVLDYPSRMVTKRAIEKSLTRPRRCIWRSRVKQKEAPIEGPITLTPKQ